MFYGLRIIHSGRCVNKSVIETASLRCSEANADNRQTSLTCGNRASQRHLMSRWFRTADHPPSIVWVPITSSSVLTCAFSTRQLTGQQVDRCVNAQPGCV
jgi:hypothetical protein